MCRRGHGARRSRGNASRGRTHGPEGAVQRTVASPPRGGVRPTSSEHHRLTTAAIRAAGPVQGTRHLHPGIALEGLARCWDSDPQPGHAGGRAYTVQSPSVCPPSRSSRHSDSLQPMSRASPSHFHARPPPPRPISRQRDSSLTRSLRPWDFMRISSRHSQASSRASCLVSCEESNRR